MSNEPIGLRGQARRAFQTGPGAPLQPEQLIALLQAVAEARGEPEQMAWLKGEYPSLYQYLDEVPDATLIAGKENPAALADSAQKIADQIAAKLEQTRWDDLGLSPVYDTLARKLTSDRDWEFIQDLEFEGRNEPRFVMNEEGYCGLLPDQSRIGHLVDWDLSNDVESRLKDLGVDKPDVHNIEFGRWLHRLTNDYLHIPPVDAALMMDAKELGVRGKRLDDDSKKWNFAKRLSLDGGPEQNYAVIPVEYALGMRGVSYNLPDHEPETVRHRCAERLAQRLLGVDAANVEVRDGREVVVHPDADGDIAHDLFVRLAEVDGKTCVIMKPDDGRVLLAPIALGDPAAKFSMRRPTFMPDATGYEGENGVFLVQAAKLAYMEQETISAYTEAWGFTHAKALSDEGTDAQAFTAYDPTENTLLVTYRGTESRKDVSIDADIGFERSENFPGCEIPGGFLAQFEALLPQIKAQVDEANRIASETGKPPPKIMIGGHSLGGALGGLLHLYGLLNDWPITQTYTCGQPAFLDKAGAKIFAAKLKETGSNFFRYVNNNDIVARLPPSATHQGVEIYINSDGKIEEPGMFQWWDRATDRLSGIVENWSLSSGIDSIDAVSDHYCDFYLGYARKNRAVQFAAGVIKPMMEAVFDVARAVNPLDEEG